MLNKYFAIGYLGQDPELHYSQAGEPIGTFNLAVDDSYTDRQGEKVKRTIWLRCASFSKTAENVANYLHKGSRVQVEGSLSANEWTDREGNVRKDLQVRLQNFTNLSPREKEDGQDNQSSSAPAPNGDGSRQPQSQRQQNVNGNNPNQRRRQPSKRNGYDPADENVFPSDAMGMDDVPF